MRGASKGEGLGNQFLSHIRTVDAIVHVVRCFDDSNVIHVDDSVDPVRDIETIDTELMLADLGTVQSSLDKARRTARTGDRDVKLRVELLEKCQALLDAGHPVRGLVDEVTHDPDAAKTLKGLSLLTAKRVLYVANVDEADPHGQSPPVVAVRQRAEAEGGVVVPVCAKDRKRIGRARRS